MKNSKKIVITLFLLFVIFTANVYAGGWIYYSDGTYKGKVIDADTGEPIEGAVVAGVWELNLLYLKLSDPLPRFCDAKEAVTNKNGEFVVPKASCVHLWPFGRIERPSFIVFKPGYLAYPPLGASPEEREAKMPGFREVFKDKNQYNIIRLGKPRTREERRLIYSSTGFSNDKARKQLPILLKLLNEERKNLGLPGKEE